MDSNKVNAMWSVSLLIIGVATFILAGASIIGLTLPDIAVRILGMMDLIALPVLGFSTVKKSRECKDDCGKSAAFLHVF